MPKDHMDSLYNSKNPLVRFVHRNRIQILASLLPKKKSKILDAGCGEGHLIQRLYKADSKHEYYGFDVKDIALKRARKRNPYAKFYLKDLSNTGIEDNFFDVIMCSEVIEHIYNYEEVLKELVRISKKTLILTFPNETLWTMSRFLIGRRPIKVPDHVNSFTPRKIIDTVPMKLHKKRTLPFGLPFVLSLNALLIFKK